MEVTEVNRDQEKPILHPSQRPRLGFGYWGWCTWGTMTQPAPGDIRWRRHWTRQQNPLNVKTYPSHQLPYRSSAQWTRWLYPSLTPGVCNKEDAKWTATQRKGRNGEYSVIPLTSCWKQLALLSETTLLNFRDRRVLLGHSKALTPGGISSLGSGYSCVFIL